MKVTSYSQFRFIKADHRTPIDDIKRQYKKLAHKLHPDLGGDEEDMKQLNNEFDFCRKHNYNIHTSQSGAVYTDETQDAPDDVTDRFTDIIEALIHMEGITAEVCGSFLWIGGNTRPHKDELKGLGFRWASKKKKWFLAPTGWRKRGHRELTMGEIRATYGSAQIDLKVAAGRLLPA